MGTWPPPPPGAEVATITAADIIRSALRAIGHLGPGRGPSESESADALWALNRMVENWSTQNLAVYAQTSASYTLTPGKGEYTIGSALNDMGEPYPVDFVAARPVKILGASIGGNVLALPDVLRWVEFINSELHVAGRPVALFDDRTHPISTLHLWPQPDEAYTLNLVTLDEFPGFATADTAVSLPPGYVEAIRYNLAVRLAIEWNKPPKGELIEMARQTLAQIKAINAPRPEMTCDPAFLNRGRFNIYTGE